MWRLHCGIKDAYARLLYRIKEQAQENAELKRIIAAESDQTMSAVGFGQDMVKKYSDVCQELAKREEAVRLLIVKLDDASKLVTGLMQRSVIQNEEIKSLRAWKESALATAIDYQVIAKVLNIPLGESVHDKILPAIERLIKNTKV